MILKEEDTMICGGTGWCFPAAGRSSSVFHLHATHYTNSLLGGSSMTLNKPLSIICLFGLSHVFSNKYHLLFVKTCLLAYVKEKAFSDQWRFSLILIFLFLPTPNEEKQVPLCYPPHCTHEMAASSPTLVGIMDNQTSPSTSFSDKASLPKYVCIYHERLCLLYVFISPLGFEKYEKLIPTEKWVFCITMDKS